MKRIALIVAALAAAIVGGCSVPSLHPIYTSDKLADDEGLAGTWLSDEGETVLRVSRSARGVFAVTVAGLNDDPQEQERPMTLTAHLVDLGGARWADLTPDESSRERLGKEHGTFAMPTHQFMRIARDGDRLTAWMFDYDKFHDALKVGTVNLAYISGEDDITVITATTAELQAFLTARAENHDLENDPVVFVRHKPSP